MSNQSKVVMKDRKDTERAELVGSDFSFFRACRQLGIFEREMEDLGTGTGIREIVPFKVIANHIL
jgi:hypothetical protein